MNIKTTWVRRPWAMGQLLFLALLVLTVAIRADDVAAVKELRKLGARVTVESKRPGEPVVGVDLIGTQITDAELKLVKELKSLRSLQLAGTHITDLGLKQLKELKNLQSLYLYGLRVSDAGLKELNELKCLQKQIG